MKCSLFFWFYSLLSISFSWDPNLPWGSHLIKRKGARMRPKKRELHELPYRELVKSGTIRLTSRWFLQKIRYWLCSWKLKNHWNIGFSQIIKSKDSMFLYFKVWDFTVNTCSKRKRRMSSFSLTPLCCMGVGAARTIHTFFYFTIIEQGRGCTMV